VAVETGGAGRSKLESYRHLTAVIDAVVGAVPHRVAVVAFDSTPSLLQNFTADADAAGASLDDLDAGDKGGAILDALKFSVDLLRRQPPNYRRAILLISETNDRGSQTQLEDALRGHQRYQHRHLQPWVFVGQSGCRALCRQGIAYSQWYGWSGACEFSPRPAAWMHGQGPRSRRHHQQGGAGI
jgi:hypothetical protein